MANSIPIGRAALPTDMDVTQLASLPSGQLWHSIAFTDGPPSAQILTISYTIVFAAIPVINDHLAMWIAKGDQAATNEIWDGGLPVTQGVLSAPADIAKAQAALGDPHNSYYWETNHDATFERNWTFVDAGPRWQLVVQPLGEALAASGHSIRYRYGSPEVQP